MLYKIDRPIRLRRLSMVSTRSIDSVLRIIDAHVGHTDIRAFRSAIANASTPEQIAQLVKDAVGPSQLLEFARFEAGQFLRNADGSAGPRTIRLLVGNPLIMREMALGVPDAASYAPITILVDERSDGVHLSYDSMESLIAPYGNAGATSVARDLDSRVLMILETAAAGPGDPT